MTLANPNESINIKLICAVKVSSVTPGVPVEEETLLDPPVGLFLQHLIELSLFLSQDGRDTKVQQSFMHQVQRCRLTCCWHASYRPCWWSDESIGVRRREELFFVLKGSFELEMEM